MSLHSIPNEKPNIPQWAIDAAKGVFESFLTSYDYYTFVFKFGKNISIMYTSTHSMGWPSGEGTSIAHSIDKEENYWSKKGQGQPNVFRKHGVEFNIMDLIRIEGEEE